MEGTGLPMLNCLLQHTLRSICCPSSDSFHSNSKWVYAVFWKILPRNYPPPKLDYGEGVLDRSKRNKRNWILVWEDGYCDFYECEQAGRFGPSVFFKMAHEVYNYGEGLVGKVAGENSHKWVFRDNTNEGDPGLIASWNVSIDSQPKAWEYQFSSGIQTIAIISVREGIVQLGSFEKVKEDLNLVISIQRKFSYLYSIPGIFAIQRPHLTYQHSKPTTQFMKNQETAALFADNKPQIIGEKRPNNDTIEAPSSTLKAMNFGWNSPQNNLTGPPVWPIPPLFPGLHCNLGALLSNLPSVAPASYNTNIERNHTVIPVNKTNAAVAGGLKQAVNIADVKVEMLCLVHGDADQDGGQKVVNPDVEVQERQARLELGHEPLSKEEECSLKLN